MSSFLLNTDDNIQKQYRDINTTISVPSAGSTYSTACENLSDVRVWASGTLYQGLRLLASGQLINGFGDSEGISGSVSINGSTVTVNLISNILTTTNVNLKIRVYYND